MGDPAFDSFTNKALIRPLTTTGKSLNGNSLSSKPPTNLTSLPTELHLLITSYLTYPDALSLKHSNRHFYNLVYTGVNLKIEWLIERRRLHLDCPNDKACELGSDLRFCRGSVRLLMKRRREHGECETRPGGRGCLVFGTKICSYRKKEKTLRAVAKRWVRFLTEGNAVFWWIFVALVGVVLGLVWGRVGGGGAGGSHTVSLV